MIVARPLGGRIHDSAGWVEPVIWREPLAHSGAHARDIAKNACFQLPLVEAVLHQITDTHDALQLAVLDDRQVTDPRYRHCRKHGIHAIGGTTTEDGRRHQLLHLKAEYGGAVSGHRVDEVPLREYADRFHPPILHDQGADAMLSQLADRKLDAVRGAYPHNVTALGPQNVGDEHGCLLVIWRTARQLYGTATAHERSLNH